MTAYVSAVSILRSKLSILDRYEDLDITVITGPPPADLKLSPPPVCHLTVPMSRHIRPLGDCATIWALYRVLRRQRFDIVHSHTAKAGVVAALAAKLARVPLILHTYHGLPFYKGQGRVRYYRYRLLDRIACRLRDHVFSQNRRDMAECVRMMGSADKVSYEGNGIDVEQVREASRRHIGRARSDFPPGALRLCMVSRLEPVKRVSDFLGACSLLMQRGIDVSAVVAGEGWLQPALEREAQARGLGRCVRLLGWTPRAPSLMAASDIVVLTSEKEGIPRSLMEAMALGKPVVATDVPGTQELVVDGDTGFLTPLGDPRALADKIELLAGDPELRGRFASAAKVRIEERFNDIKIAAFLRRFYLEEYRRRAGPGEISAVQ